MKSYPRRCGYDGTAVVQITDGVAAFTQADEKIHIADELIDQDNLLGLLATYRLGRWCDDEHAWHADLIPTQPTKGTP